MNSCVKKIRRNSGEIQWLINELTFFESREPDDVWQDMQLSFE